MTCCKYCGGPVEWKDERGWYRKFCEECAHRIAGGEDLRASYDPSDDPVEGSV